MLADQIMTALTINYDKKPADTALEKIIHQASKKSYIKLLVLWKENYKDISKVKIEIDPVINDIIKIIEKYSSKKEAELFTKQFEQLMMLSLENFGMYLNAVKESKYSTDLTNITCDYIDLCLSNLKYYKIQKELYQRETFLTASIHSFMLKPEVKDKLWFYIFVHNLLIKYRQKTINRLLNSCLAKIKENEK
jgi:hypothetical protein